MKREYTLIVDVGNSTTVFGVFEKDRFVDYLVTNTFEPSKKSLKLAITKFLEGYAEQNFKFVNGMIFSVVPTYNDDVLAIAKKFFKVKLGIFDWQNYEYKAKDPRITDKIGADLLADLKGAEMIYGHPAMVVDLGTVNKVLLTDKDGKFIGASFTPGMQGALGMFSSHTALLPKVNEMEELSPELGLGTVESMKHGVYWSTVAYIEHEHKAQEELLNHPIYLILTGGNSVFVKDRIENKIYDPILTLKGMYYLYIEVQK